MDATVWMSKSDKYLLVKRGFITNEADVVDENHPVIVVDA
jgi:hypothetical protein